MGYSDDVDERRARSRLLNHWEVDKAGKLHKKRIYEQN